MDKNFDATKPRYSEHILPIRGPLFYRGSTVGGKIYLKREVYLTAIYR